MSVSRGKGFFKQYAKSSYMQKINPEFEGITKKYYNEKKEHDKLHSIKKNLDKEVAYIQRMDQHLQSTLQKKKKQLEFTKEVGNRLLTDIRRREWISEFKSHSVKNNQEKASLMKYDSERKLKEAKLYMTENKRSLANLNRDENARVKEMKSLKQAKEWDMNRSRASEIYQFKQEVKQHTNKFYQTRNASSMSGYQKRIQSYKNFQAFDNQKISELQKARQTLAERNQKKKSECDVLSKEIERIRRETKIESSLVRSRLKSGSSMNLSVHSDHSRKNSKHSKRNSESPSVM